MNKTPIEYLDYTWNPIAMRCTPVSAGCANCWHLRMANRMAGMTHFSPEVRAAYAGEGPPVLIEERLAEPLKRRKSARIGVMFMGDLFHEDISFQFITNVFAIMYNAQQHIYQVLTKRPGRMLEFLNWYIPSGKLAKVFPNVWFGVSVENQQAADERIPLLLQIPAAVRFVSCEPLLGRVDVEKYLLSCNDCGNQGSDAYMNYEKSLCRACIKGVESSSLDWLVVGAETGPGARPMHPDWARSLRDQAQEAGVPFFMKQMSGKAPIPDDLMIREYPK